MNKMMSLMALRRLGILTSKARTWCRAENVVRMLRTTNIFAVKSFVETENKIMYSVLLAKPECAKTLARYPEPPSVDTTTFNQVLAHNWISESPTKVFDAFALVSAYGPSHGHEITEEIFDNLCDSVKVKCSEMSDDQLVGVLVNLARWPQTKMFKSRNFDLWMAVDKACTARTKDWDKPQLLFVADHFYRLYLVRKSKFMVACLRKLCRKPSHLTPAQLVQTMFYINSHRKADAVAEMFEMEYTLETCANSLSLEDLALVAAGYFKTERKIRSERLLSRIAEVAGEGAGTAHDVTLTALLKVLRYSMPLSMMDQLYSMQERLLQHVPRFSLMACTHAALAGTNAQVLHEGLMLAVAQRFAREAAEARIKDVERMALALGLFDVQPPPEHQPCVFEVLQRELRNPAREEEMSSFSKCVPRTLYFLSLKRIFPLDLLETVLHPDYVTRVFGPNSWAYELELLALDMAVGLECPAYQGPRLDSRARTIISKRFRMRLPFLDAPDRGAFTDRLLGQILVAATEAAGGPQRAAARHVLPHFARGNVLVRVDAAATAQAGRVVFLPLPQWLLDDPAGGEPRPAPDDGALWFVLVAAGYNSYVHGDGNGRYIATTSALLRQLASIGYRPIVVSWQDWGKVPAAGRADFVRRLLQEEIANAAAASPFTVAPDPVPAPAPADSNAPAAGAL